MSKMKDHWNGWEVDKLLKTFPLTTAKLRRALPAAIEQVKSEYKAVQERLVLQRLPEKVSAEYQSLRNRHPQIRSQLFFQLAMGLVGVCDKCGVTTSFRCSKNEWQSFCSNVCANDHVLKARTKTWKAKYGVDNPTKHASVRKKLSIAQTGNCRVVPVEAPLPPAPPYKPDSRFYVYAIMDPRKDALQSGGYKFKHEPFYIGKGHGGRVLDHFKTAHRKKDPKSLRISRIAEETGDFPPVRIFRCKSELEAYNLEIKLIHQIGRRGLRTGPLHNLTAGGEGISGMVFTDTHRKNISTAVRAYYALMSDEDRAAHAERSRLGTLNRQLKGR